MSFYSKKQVNENFKSIGMNFFTQKELDEAQDRLKNTSKDKTFTDKYKEDMTKQQMFTSTKEQFNNSDYTPSSTIGLGDTSLDVIPILKSTVIINTITPIVKKTVTTTIKRSKKIVEKVNKLDYDMGIYIGVKKDNIKIPDKLKWVKDTGYNDINDAFNSSLPPATAGGVIYNTGKEIFDKLTSEDKSEDND